MTQSNFQKRANLNTAEATTFRKTMKAVAANRPEGLSTRTAAWLHDQLEKPSKGRAARLRGDCDATTVREQNEDFEVQRIFEDLAAEEEILVSTAPEMWSMARESVELVRKSYGIDP
ncbi:hypothetical protein [Arthrobacter rhombi]|uniref:hypothetical protein n=1 Tax=Arthrobacter rhombi TaxID=71253 RepID=UPI003FD4071F